VRGGLLAMAVDDDRLETLAGQFADRRLGFGDVGDIDIEVTENPAQYAQNLFVRGEN